MKLDKSICIRCANRNGAYWTSIDDWMWAHRRRVMCRPAPAVRVRNTWYYDSETGTTDFPPSWCPYAAEQIAQWAADQP